MTAEWLKYKAQGNDEYGNKYGIWSVERIGDGGNLDEEEKFERRGLTDWRLLPNVQRTAANIGENTAVRQIQLTYDKNAGDGKLDAEHRGAAPYGEQVDQMFRNRMVANIGELRAMDEPVEFALSEENPECADYFREVRRRPEMTRLQERIQPQPRLQPMKIPCR